MRELLGIPLGANSPIDEEVCAMYQPCGHNQPSKFGGNRRVDELYWLGLWQVWEYASKESHWRENLDARLRAKRCNGNGVVGRP